jgi:hypothetical protein
VAIMRLANSMILASLMAASLLSAQDAPKVEYHGAGWMQIGYVEHSDNGIVDYNKNWMQSGGAQLNATLHANESWDVGLGLGAVQVHLIRGPETNGNWYPFTVPYVAEARATYTKPALFSEGDKLQITAGYFPYGYNPDAKNLGVYLMKGYVYPGTLASGFGNVFGAQARYQKGGFKNDVILNSETDDRPFFDYSLIDAVAYEITPGLELGAGVNFYRLLKQDKKTTAPGKECIATDLGTRATGCYIIDTTGVGAGGQPDTVTGSLAGTKIMTRFHADPKLLFGFSSIGGLALGKGDLILYGEAAILGLKDYPVFYDDMLRRIPVMVGFNFPAFGVLDNLSLEVEYYASKNSSDNLGAQNGSWVPKVNPGVNYARDDWKWSVNASKVIFGHMSLSGQVANDHLRLGGTHDSPEGTEALGTPADWYWSCKLAYFF